MNLEISRSFFLEISGRFLTSEISESLYFTEISGRSLTSEISKSLTLQRYEGGSLPQRYQGLFTLQRYKGGTLPYRDISREVLWFRYIIETLEISRSLLSYIDMRDSVDINESLYLTQISDCLPVWLHGMRSGTTRSRPASWTQGQVDQGFYKIPVTD